MTGVPGRVGRGGGAWLLGMAWLACSPPAGDPPSAATRSSATLSVYTVNHPLQYFAERIGGERVTVRFPAPRDVDPADWMPDAETVARFQEADLIVLNGAGYEAWLTRASLPAKRLVDTSSGFSDRLIAIDRALTHQHGPQGAHSHASTAFTTWLDPTLAREQARAVAEALARERPAHEGVFREALAALEADLEALDERLAAVARRLDGAPVVYSHPVYQYLDRRYDLNGRSVHWEPDEAPDAEMWRDLEALLREHPAELMLWEDTPRAETAQRLEALGVRSVVFAPGAIARTDGDWLSVMRANAERLERAVGID